MHFLTIFQRPTYIFKDNVEQKYFFKDYPGDFLRIFFLGRNIPPGHKRRFMKNIPRSRVGIINQFQFLKNILEGPSRLENLLKEIIFFHIILLFFFQGSQSLEYI